MIVEMKAFLDLFKERVILVSSLRRAKAVPMEGNTGATPKLEEKVLHHDNVSLSASNM